MKNELLYKARMARNLIQQQLADLAGISVATVIRAEKGNVIRLDNVQYLCEYLQKTPEELGFVDMNRREASKTIASMVVGGLLLPTFTESSRKPVATLWTYDVLAHYADGIKACQNLYFSGKSEEVKVILPLFMNQTTLIAQQSSPLQAPAARLASLAQQLCCEIATDKEDFGQAKKLARQAFEYAELAEDRNLQVSSLISLANIGFHRKISTEALRAYQQAVSLFDETVTSLTRGRTYVGLAEVYAMHGQLQEAMRAMGMAYECYPDIPEYDPAYQHLRASRYALYMFGDLQSRLFLGQPQEAENALKRMLKENSDIHDEPITKLDMLYYMSDIHMANKNIEASVATLTEAATLAKKIKSTLYLNKLATSYEHLLQQFPSEEKIHDLEEVFIH